MDVYPCSFMSSENELFCPCIRTVSMKNLTRLIVEEHGLYRKTIVMFRVIESNNGFSEVGQ